MFMGVPMAPVIVVTGLCVVLAVLGLYVSPFATIAVIAIYFPIYFWMRMVTKTDDQRLNQLFLRLRMRMRLGASRRIWGAFTYTPIAYKKRTR
jgi:type IV secretion system protein VirB3